MIHFENPKVTVDTVIFTIHNKALHILLVRRKNHPFQGSWALPGGFLEKDEDILKAAYRELYEETGVRKIYLEQLYTFGTPGRDPRGRVVTVAYMALVAAPITASAGSDAADVRWWPVENLPRLAFDHREILSYARERLRYKLEYSNAAWALLPEKFTLTDLQAVYETAWGRKMDKRNFRKKILALSLLRPIKEMRRGLHQRPAQLYVFRTKKKVELKKFF